MRFSTAVAATLAVYLLCTGFTSTAASNLKGDPEVDPSYKQPTIVKQVHLPNDLDAENDIGDPDLGLDPFDELDQHVEKMVKHLDVSMPRLELHNIINFLQVLKKMKIHSEQWPM